MDSFVPRSINDVVGQITGIHKSLPERPKVEEIEAAKTLIRQVEVEDQARLDAIGKQSKSLEVSDELFLILQEMQKKFVCFKSNEQKREALRLLDIESVHYVFDEMIQRASRCLEMSSGLNLSYQSGVSNSVGGFVDSGLFSVDSLVVRQSLGAVCEKESVRGGGEMFSRDDSYVKKAKSSFYGDGVRVGEMLSVQIVDSSLKTVVSSGMFLLLN